MPEQTTDYEDLDLSEEERSALEDGSDKDKADDEQANEPGDEGGKEPEGESPDRPEPEQASQPEQEPEPEPQQQPTYTATVPEERQNRLEEIKGEIEELRASLDRGDITFLDYESQRDTLKDEQADIRMEMSRARIASEMQEQALQRDWEQARARFFSRPENAPFTQDTGEFNPLNAALDSAVRQIASDPRVESMTFDQVLEEARNSILSRMGQSMPKQPEKAAPKRGLGESRDSVPPTLGGLPSHNDNLRDENPFAHLDGLSGDELEDAVSRMTPEQQAAWARAA